MEVILYVFSGLLGLVVGSFLNVVIYRLPRGESLVRPGSHCPKCGADIRWFDNVPLVSWALLHGKCRACGTEISKRYPFVEALTAAAFLLSAWRFAFSWELLVSWLFVAALIVVAFIDFDHMIIPNKIVLPGALVGLAASIAMHPHRWWVYLAGSLGGATFLLLLVLVWPGGMGPGDVKMALFMGAFLGAEVLVALFLAFLSGAVVGLYLILVKKRSRKSRVPFGPFLAFGSVVALYVGELILRSYLSLYA